jgi:hypothetical protein
MPRPRGAGQLGELHSELLTGLESAVLMLMAVVIAIRAITH